MKTFRLFVFLFCVLGLGKSALAQVLWNGTSYGMSPVRVKALMPKAFNPGDKGDTLQDGSIELLRLKNVELVGQSFTASFFFRESKLRQVTLSADGERSLDSRGNTFDALAEALRVKYGKELNRSQTGTGLASIEASWQSGKTNISLFMMEIGSGQSILNINYQVRLAAEASKL